MWTFCAAGFQAVYSQLTFAGKSELDPCVEVQDAKALLAKSLGTLCSTQPNVSSQFLLLLQFYFILYLVTSNDCCVDLSQ